MSAWGTVRSKHALVVLVSSGLLDLKNRNIVLAHLDNALGNVFCLTLEMVYHAD